MSIAGSILMNMTLGGGRLATSPDDWGDDGTIGLQLKTRDDEGFGVFCGRHEGKFAVARYIQWTWTVGEIELFDTEESMKEKWRLD